MEIATQIEHYLASLSETKQRDMRALHGLIIDIMPTSQLWFLSGKNEENKIVANPNIGYGVHDIKYANGTTQSFYKIGISANTTGISVYVFGIDDKGFLSKTYGNRIGKASVSGYCIKFKKMEDLNIDVLKELIQHEMGDHENKIY